MWYDEDRHVCGGLEELSNFDITDLRNVKLSSDETALLFCQGSEGSGNSVIVKLNLHEGWQEKWQFSSDDKCFYYKGLIRSDQTTDQLIDSVEMSEDVYDMTVGHTLRIDVLADAIQQSGNASSRRQWEQ